MVFGGPRHLALAETLVGDRGRPWPVPFDIGPVLAERGRRVAVLASGDPFWFGAGGSLVGHLAPGEWVSHPAPATFALAANRLGWRLEEVACLGLHALPMSEIRPELKQNRRAICLMRDGAAVGELARYLTGLGFGASRLWVMEALGGPRERIRACRAEAFALADVAAPVAVALEADGPPLPRGPGLPDALFDHDGQITRRPIRALAISALAPRPGELLWDIGAGSGSIGIEWLLSGGGHCHAIEADALRAARAVANAAKLGVGQHYTMVQGRILDRLDDMTAPDAAFVGGGASEELLSTLWTERLAPGSRLVIHAVTLETEALLVDWSGRHGGELLRIDIAEAAPLGTRRGWKPARPIVQWSVTR